MRSQHTLPHTQTQTNLITGMAKKVDPTAWQPAISLIAALYDAMHPERLSDCCSRKIAEVNDCEVCSACGNTCSPDLF